MIGTQYTITNQQGDFLIINDHSDPQNVIALQDYPTFDLDIRNEEIAKDGQHGIWDFYSFYGRRLIVFSGVIVGEDEAHVLQLRDQLINVTKLPGQPSTGDDGTMTITFTDPIGRALSITAKLQSSIRFSRPLKHTFKLDFQLVMKSTDVAFESQTPITNSGVRGWPTGEVLLPMTMPTPIASTYQNMLTITNAGNTEANLKVRLYGVVTNPAIRNVTTGKTMTILTSLASTSDYVEINSKTGTIMDQAGNDLSGLISPGSQFVTLISGDNDLVYLSAENFNDQSPLVTRVEPTEIFETEYHATIL